MRPGTIQLLSILVFLLALGLYASTLAPGMLRGDSGEFQWAMASLNVAHATGYPFFTLVGRAWEVLVPLGAVAYRLNWLSGIAGALAVTIVYRFAHEMTGRRAAALAGAAALAVAPVSWLNASILEVYPLNTLFLALVLWLLWKWGKAPEARHALRYLTAAAFVYGLALAHHRMMILAAPAIALYVLWADRARRRDGRRLALPVLALFPGLALYLYVYLRLLLAGESPQFAFYDIILGREYSASLFQQFQPVQVLLQIPWNNLHVGLLVAALGAFSQFRGEPRLAGLLALTLVLDLAFALVYWVPDVEVFVTPALLVLALWIAVGAGRILDQIENRGQARWVPAAGAAAVLIALAPLTRVAEVRAAVAVETSDVEARARRLLAADLPAGAILELDWETATATRFLQTTEGTRTDLDARLIHIDRREEYHRILEAVQAGRPVLLDPGIQLNRFVAGFRWSRGPLDMVRLDVAPVQVTPVGQRVSDRLELVGYASEPSRSLLVWRALAALPSDYATFVHFFDSEGGPLGQQDKGACCEPVYGYATSQWEPGRQIADSYRPWPAGVTYLRTGLYSTATGDIEPYGATLYLQVSPVSLQGLEQRTNLVLGNAIGLAGYALTRREGNLDLVLYWESRAAVKVDFKVFVHALDAQGKIVNQADRMPLDGLYPTHAWLPGQVIRDDLTLPAAPGAVRLRLGMYDPQNNARLTRGDTGGDSFEIPLP